MPAPSIGKMLASIGAALFGFLFTANIITHYSWGENPGKLFTVTVDQIDQTSVPSDLLPYLKSGNKYPVGEWNQNLDVYGNRSEEHTSELQSH